jgi:glycosyltransferase involved in cell wall biosynthesis
VEGVTSERYDRRHFGLPPDRVIFAFNFDASSSYARKNPMGLIGAFRRAFTEGERTDAETLVIKTLRLDVFPALSRALRTEVAATTGVRLITDDLSNDEMASLLSCADVYVSLHRAEGFGLGMAEAMRLGRPVIATAYSANLEFCRTDNCAQVGWSLVPVSDSDHEWHPDMTGLYRAGQLWAEPDLDQAAWWMRWLWAHPRERVRLGAAGRETIEREYSRATAGAAMRARLEELAATR